MLLGQLVGGLVRAKTEELIMKGNASEFVIHPDVSESFILVQVNEEKLEAGERVLIINTDKMRIVRDLSSKFPNRVEEALLLPFLLDPEHVEYIDLLDAHFAQSEINQFCELAVSVHRHACLGVKRVECQFVPEGLPNLSVLIKKPVDVG